MTGPVEKKTAVVVVRKIYVEYGDGAALEVGPDNDTGSWVEVRSGDDKESKDWFGQGFRFSVSPQTALVLAAHMKKTAEDILEAK